jgi:hypothetical protein
MDSSFTNTSIFTKRADGPLASPHVTAFTPLLCLLTAVVLLSSITPTIKYVFQHSDLHPIALASLHVAIGFFVLMLSMMLWDRRGAKDVVGAATVPLTLLGLLGVASYAVAAWGLLYTSVTHYILIYSLMPSITAIFSPAREPVTGQHADVRRQLAAVIADRGSVRSDGVGGAHVRTDFAVDPGLGGLRRGCDGRRLSLPVHVPAPAESHDGWRVP